MRLDLGETFGILCGRSERLAAYQLEAKSRNVRITAHKFSSGMMRLNLIEVASP
jgi:hypothetical protein